MKKLNFLALLLMLAFFANAQRTVSNAVSVDMPKFMGSELKAVTDTIMPDNWIADSVTIYSSSNGGFVCGINGYGDLAKAQEYTPATSYDVYGALMLIPVKFDNDTTNPDQGGFDFNLWYFVNDEPSTIQATKTYTYDDIDTTGYTVCMFDTAVTVDQRYAIGFDASVCYTESSILSAFGLASTTDGTAGTTMYSWEMWSDLTWWNFADPNDWNLAIDLAVFPVVDMGGSIGIDDVTAIEGVKMSTYPNPAVSELNIEYQLENAENVSITLVNMNGQKVVSLEKGLQTAGSYNETIDVNELANGTYFVAIQAGATRFAQRVIVK